MATNRMIDRFAPPGKAKAAATPTSAPTGTVKTSPEFDEIKRAMHNELLDTLDFEEVANTAKEELYERMRQSLTDRMESRNPAITRPEVLHQRPSAHDAGNARRPHRMARAADCGPPAQWRALQCGMPLKSCT